jgi:ribosomal protein L29
MERGAWTNERLDDLAEAMRSGFDRSDRDIRDTRTELKAEIVDTRTALKTEIADTRSELKAEVADTRGQLKAEIAELRQMTLRIGAAMMGTMMVGFLSVLAAILTRGA